MTMMQPLSPLVEAMQFSSVIPPTSYDSIEPRLHLVGIGSPDRSRAEHYIWTRFRKQYGADVQHYMPWLLGLSCAKAGDDYCAMLGYRFAAEGPLFLENYLDVSIEAAIARATGEKVARHEVLEVGNLAADRRIGASLLFIALTVHLYPSLEWVTCTITPTVANIFRRLGMPFAELAPAEASKLGEAREQWGSYYDRNISVQYVKSTDVYHSLEQNPKYANLLSRLKAEVPPNPLSLHRA